MAAGIAADIVARRHGRLAVAWTRLALAVVPPMSNEITLGKPSAGPTRAERR